MKKWIVILFVRNNPEMEVIVEVEASTVLAAKAEALDTRNMPWSWSIHSVIEA